MKPILWVRVQRARLILADTLGYDGEVDVLAEMIVKQLKQTEMYLAMQNGTHTPYLVEYVATLTKQRDDLLRERDAKTGVPHKTKMRWIIVGRAWAKIKKLPGLIKPFIKRLHR